MKFGEKFLEKQNPEYLEYYINYKELKKIIKKEDSDKFMDILKINLNKINWFFNKFTEEYKNTNQLKIQNFLVINYMAILKAIKKHDKRCAKNYKIKFFNWIKREPFYNYYLNLPRIQNKIELIIFDKDGTLILLHKIFSKWLIKLADNLLDLGINKDLFFKEVGYDVQNNKFLGNSIVAKGTNDDIRNCIYKNIIDNNDITNDIGSIQDLVSDKWIDIELDVTDIETCGDIKGLFEFIKSKNIKIAICTSDDREPTNKFIEYLGLEKYLDKVNCGDDLISNKPSPEPIWDICNTLNIDVTSTIMIGDTISDIHAGINAKCGKVIGVLSGGYDKNELDDADIIIPSIDNIISLFNDKIIF